VTASNAEIVDALQFMFTRDEVHTAMCLWESWLRMSDAREHADASGQRRLTEQAQALLAYQRIVGTVTLRLKISYLVRKCDDCWTAYEAMSGERRLHDFDEGFVDEWLLGRFKDGAFEQSGCLTEN
jgi:hypothetical protein